MSNRNPDFSSQEYQARLTKTRHAMAERGIDLMIISDPEQTYCETRLGQWQHRR
jgi:Xaa-Pro aminopeptidase